MPCLAIPEIRLDPSQKRAAGGAVLSAGWGGDGVLTADIHSTEIMKLSNSKSATLVLANITITSKLQRWSLNSSLSCFFAVFSLSNIRLLRLLIEHRI